MKFILPLFFLLSVAAYADTGSQFILKDPTVAAIAKLMNDKHQGQCQQLTDADVTIHGTGWIPDVNKPTLVAVGSFFSVTVKCTTENATIRGMTTLWELALPRTIDPKTGLLNPIDPELLKLRPAPVSGGNTIMSVTFSPANP